MNQKKLQVGDWIRLTRPPFNEVNISTFGVEEGKCCRIKKIDRLYHTLEGVVHLTDWNHFKKGADVTWGDEWLVPVDPFVVYMLEMEDNPTES